MIPTTYNKALQTVIDLAQMGGQIAIVGIHETVRVRGFTRALDLLYPTGELVTVRRGGLPSLTTKAGGDIKCFGQYREERLAGREFDLAWVLEAEEEQPIPTATLAALKTQVTLGDNPRILWSYA